MSRVNAAGVSVSEEEGDPSSYLLYIHHQRFLSQLISIHVKLQRLLQHINEPSVYLPVGAFGASHLS